MFPGPHRRRPRRFFPPKMELNFATPLLRRWGQEASGPVGTAHGSPAGVGAYIHRMAKGLICRLLDDSVIPFRVLWLRETVLRYLRHHWATSCQKIADMADTSLPLLPGGSPAVILCQGRPGGNLGIEDCESRLRANWKDTRKRLLTIVY